MSTRKRAIGIKINLTEAKHQELVQVSEALGMTPATLASFAVGQFLAQQRLQISLIERVTEGAGPAIREHLENAQLALEGKA
jgi:hypothetical protein